MNERERIAKILTRPITQTERNQFARNTAADANDTLAVISRLTEAILELAESFDSHVHHQNGGDIHHTGRPIT